MLWDENLPRHVATDGNGRTTTVTVIAGGTKITMNQDGDLTIESVGSMTLKANGNMSLEATNIDVKAQANLSLQANAQATLKSGAILSLPMHPELSDDDVKYVVASTRARLRVSDGTGQRVISLGHEAMTKEKVVNWSDFGIDL